MNVIYDSAIAKLKYPRDASRIARLSISGFQCWYLAQDRREIIYMAQFKEFQRFVYWNYTIKVQALRMFYRIKRLFIHA